MHKIRYHRIAAALMLAASMTSGNAAFRDPLDTPAMQSAIAANSPMIAIAPAGKRLVAVGQRGHILVSDDGGKQWAQMAVPVSSDLVAVHFPSADKGWAVGHDGIVLHSSDGGRHWTKQLDGKAAAKAMVDYYRKEAQAGNAAVKEALAEAERFAEQGPVHPFLDVWFDSDQTGFVIGAFGLIFQTRDGGKTWTPWYDRIENPNGLHLYAIRSAHGKTYIVGEQGLILRLDPDKQRFVSVPGPYQGTYFGLVLQRDNLVVFGMRGNAFRSGDAGKNWTKADTNVREGIPGGVALGDGRIVLVTQGGNLLVSNNQGATFSKRPASRAAAFAGAAATNDGVALAGSLGVSVEPLK